MTKYTVQKGDHYSLHGQWVHFNATGMVVSFCVHPQSAYNIDEKHQLEENKIGGIIFGLGGITDPEIHDNSIRICMCCPDPIDHPELINVYLYYYNHGIRTSILLYQSLLGIYNSVYVDFDKTNSQLIAWNRMGNEKIKAPFEFIGVPTWGFYCYPYWGGETPAPVNYIVDLSVVTI